MDRGFVVLIGFMGAGKTTVGKCLSGMLSLPLLDTDAMIEEEAGMEISRIFGTLGEEFFRSAETEALARLAKRAQPAVIATGGGMPLREENRRLLRALGPVVYLRVSPRTVLARLAGDDSRPLLRGADRREKTERLLALRDPVYRAAAHVTVETDDLRPREAAEEIARRLREGNFGPQDGRKTEEQKSGMPEKRGISAGREGAIG